MYVGVQECLLVAAVLAALVLLVKYRVFSRLPLRRRYQSRLLAGVMTQAIDVVTDDTDNITNNVMTIDKQGKKVAEEMQSVSAATEQQSASAQEIASASDALAKLAQEMQLSLRKFQY